MWKQIFTWLYGPALSDIYVLIHRPLRAHSNSDAYTHTHTHTSACTHKHTHTHTHTQHTHTHFSLITIIPYSIFATMYSSSHSLPRAAEFWRQTSSRKRTVRINMRVLQRHNTGLCHNTEVCEPNSRVRYDLEGMHHFLAGSDVITSTAY